MTILSRKKIIERIMRGEEKLQDAMHGELKQKWNEYDGIPEEDIKGKEAKFEDYFRALENLGPEVLEKRLDKIKKAAKELHSGKDSAILIHDLDPECLQGANYDLRLGEDFYVTTNRMPEKLTGVGSKKALVIEPGEFGLLMTHEYLCMPSNLMAFISIRMRYKCRGLVNISGFHVDPNWCGKLLFAVYNAGPNDVVLRYKERVFMIMFEEVSEEVPRERPESIYHGQENIPIETILGLRGTSVSVRNLDERVRRLEITLAILTSITIGLVGVVLMFAARGT